MGSLPEQHIDSLPKEAREKAYQQVGMLCAARMKGYSEDYAAAWAKFDSVEDMDFRLERWGLSGLIPPSQKQQHPKQRRERKPQLSEGEPVELPSPKDAIPLFEDTQRFITGEIMYVASLKETLEGRRFMREGGGGQWFPDPDLTRLIGCCLVEHGARLDTVERLVEALHPNPEEANREKLYNSL